MSVPLSPRLQCCASLIHPNARIADVGADHCYLGIYLLLNGQAQYVAACDLRNGPLENARRNAIRSNIYDKIDFFLSDGLQAIDPYSIDTIVCAGMGGDLITKILSEAPWLQSAEYTLILQPQTGIPDLRVWLSEHGFYEEKADLVRDNGFLYCVMRVRYGKTSDLTPGQQFISSAILSSGSPLLHEYFMLLKTKINKIICGLIQASAGADPQRLKYYQTALHELEIMEAQYDKSL